jgi:hypothetical protein
LVVSKFALFIAAIIASDLLFTTIHDYWDWLGVCPAQAAQGCCPAAVRPFLC